MSTGHFRRTRGHSPRVLKTAPTSGASGAVGGFLVSTGHFRRTRGHSPRVLKTAPASGASARKP